MKTNLKITILLLVSWIIFTNNAAAQSPADDAPIKVDTLLFTIPLTVSDRRGRHVPGLKKEDFSILQGGEKQEIEFFVADQAPMNVAILVDTSFSTKPVLGNIQKAARDFIKIFRAEDKGLIVSFDYKTQFLSELTADRNKLSKAINHTSITGQSGSDMNDAVYHIINDYFASVKGRKAIIVLTDGIVSGKFIADGQVLESLQKTDTLLYPIVFKTSSYFIRDSKAPNAPLTSPFEHLKLLADRSAGRFYQKDATNLREAFESIAEEIKTQYLIGFYPPKAARPEMIQITVNQKDATVQTKKDLNF